MRQLLFLPITKMLNLLLLLWWKVQSIYILLQKLNNVVILIWKYEGFKTYFTLCVLNPNNLFSHLFVTQGIYLCSLKLKCNPNILPHIFQRVCPSLVSCCGDWLTCSVFAFTIKSVRKVSTKHNLFFLRLPGNVFLN